jgi:hypothetical protein
VHLGDKVESYQPPVSGQAAPQAIKETAEPVANETLETGSYSFRLEELAYARSGDKGNNCNIGKISLFVSTAVRRPIRKLFRLLVQTQFQIIFVTPYLGLLTL